MLKLKLLLTLPKGVFKLIVIVTWPFTALAETHALHPKNVGVHHCAAAKLSYPFIRAPSFTFDTFDMIFCLFPYS